MTLVQKSLNGEYYPQGKTNSTYGYALHGFGSDRVEPTITAPDNLIEDNRFQYYKTAMVLWFIKR